jgi:putative oxidoreductase
MAQGNSGTASSIGLLVLRVGLGAMMIYGHGFGKLMHFSERAAKFSDPLHIGSQNSLALAVFAECLCSALVILGFATRLAVIPLITTMGVALLLHHADDPWNKKELAAVYLVPFVALLFTGPGRYSLDAKLGPRVTFKGGS